MTEQLSAHCPKCRSEMIYVTHLPHAHARQMQRTTFVCYTCKQTRNYVLTLEMAAAYAAKSAPALSD